MDLRAPLYPGTPLRLKVRAGCIDFYITRQVGRGSGCLTYSAVYLDNPGNKKLVRIKECCPLWLRFSREPEGEMRVRQEDRARFEDAKNRFREAYRLSCALFGTENADNAAANTADICEANGTVYVVYTWLNGQTLDTRKPASLREPVSLLIGTARALEAVHRAGYLYLDLKSENILTVRGSDDLVQLFDFDSLLALEDLRAVIKNGGDATSLNLSCTKGYAAPELLAGKLTQLSERTDVYSLGAVLFRLMWKRTPMAFDCGPEAEYSFDSGFFADRAYQDTLYRALTAFFRKTLASFPEDRYSSMAEAAAALADILPLSDERVPCLISSPIEAPAVFIGREKELAALTELMSTPGHRVFSLWGMGGIGKSVLARAWIAARREDYDAVMYLYDRGIGAMILADDLTVRVNTVTRDNAESPEEYLDRKSRALRDIAAERNILAVIDNVRPESLNGLKPVFDIGWRVLLLSRGPLPEGFCPAMRLAELAPEQLEPLFAHYAGLDIRTERDRRDFLSMVKAVGGHTLTVELLARQTAKSFLTLREAARLVEESGFGALPKDRIDYIRDRETLPAPLTVILDKLTAIDSFPPETASALKLIALFPPPGIRVPLFRKLNGMADTEALSGLIAAGWLTVRDRRADPHPLMREYIREKPWRENDLTAADHMMARLLERLRPEAALPDADRQYLPRSPERTELIAVSELLAGGVPGRSAAKQQLLFRLLIDAPVDRDEDALARSLELLRHPEHLDHRQVLRLYENSAFLAGRLDFEQAHALLAQMAEYLTAHPSHYYTAALHRAEAVITHNERGREALKECVEHEDLAIAAARLSRHPEAKKQLASCLMDKAITLLDSGDRRGCLPLIREAEPLMEEACGPLDYERYQFHCLCAMAYALCVRREQASRHLRSATGIALKAQDSPLSYIEHLLDQAVPILRAMGSPSRAAEAAREAAALCDEHAHISRYRQARRDAEAILRRLP